MGDGDAVGEDDVATDAEVGTGEGEVDGLLEGGACGHEGGGGDGAGVVKLGDGPVDAGGEAEVVCVDDEAGGHGFQEWRYLVDTDVALTRSKKAYPRG